MQSNLTGARLSCSRALSLARSTHNSNRLAAVAAFILLCPYSGSFLAVQDAGVHLVW